MQVLFYNALYLTFIDYPMYDKVNVELKRVFQQIKVSTLKEEMK